MTTSVQIATVLGKVCGMVQIVELAKELVAIRNSTEMTIMNSIEAMKQMVHEMEYVLSCINANKMPFDGDDFHEALRLGRQVIAEAENHIEDNLAMVQEPVAWKTDDIELYVREDKYGAYNIPLYTSPPQRQWVGLNDDEKELIVGMCCKKDSSHDDAERVAKSIEAKLKEKNT